MINKYCIVCGSENNLHNHHYDYINDLTIPVCASCHAGLNFIKRNKDKPAVKWLRCKKCSYSWQSCCLGLKTSCPSCRGAVTINKIGDHNENKQ